MNLRVITSSSHPATIALEGSLDLHGVEEVETPFLAAISAHPGAVVDLSQLTFVASLGMRMFIAAHKILALTGKPLIVFSPNPQVRKIIHHSGMDSLLTIAEDETEARSLATAG
jgi:anti-anti-sigma factor